MKSLSIRELLIAGLVAALNIAAGVGSCMAAGGAPIPAPPPFTSPDIKPTFADWLTAKPIALAKKIRITDPLLKPPFAAAPPGSLKAMAAGIRAQQLDVPNRVKAVQFLGTVDCITYPDAQKMLIATMQEDPSEVVRYEAVMALRNMLTNCCDNMDSPCQCEPCCNRRKIARETERHARKGERALVKEAKGPAKKAAIQAKRLKEEEGQRYDCCRGCANPEVMKALAEVASAKDDQCCWVEPSERVRVAAGEAMCLFRTYPDGYMLAEPVDGTGETDPDGPKEVGPPMDEEVDPNGKAPAIPDKIPEADPSDAAKAFPPVKFTQPKAASPTPILQAPTTQIQDSGLPSLKGEPEALSAPIIPGLKGRCIVALKSRQLVAANPQISSVYEQRTYHFSSREAKAAFDQNPSLYAPAYGGIDPVAWLAERTMTEGQVLREYEGKFFLFANKENWEAFRNNPQRYVLKDAKRNVQPVSHQQ